MDPQRRGRTGARKRALRGHRRSRSLLARAAGGRLGAVAVHLRERELPLLPVLRAQRGPALDGAGSGRLQNGARSRRAAAGGGGVERAAGSRPCRCSPARSWAACSPVAPRRWRCASQRSPANRGSTTSTSIPVCAELGPSWGPGGRQHGARRGATGRGPVAPPLARAKITGWDPRQIPIRRCPRLAGSVQGSPRCRPAPGGATGAGSRRASGRGWHTPGGVPVAAEVARALDAPLDVAVVRKIGAPQNPEYAIGALAEGGVHVLSEQAAHALRLTEDEREALIARVEGELEQRPAPLPRRPRADRAHRPYGDPCRRRSRDGPLGARGGALAAPAGRRAGDPRGAGGGAPVGAVARRGGRRGRMRGDAPDLWAVGYWYQDFSPTTEAEVVALLAAGNPDPGSQPQALRRAVRAARAPALGLALGLLVCPAEVVDRGTAQRLAERQSREGPAPGVARGLQRDASTPASTHRCRTRLSAGGALPSCPRPRQAGDAAAQLHATRRSARSRRRARRRC